MLYLKSNEPEKFDKERAAKGDDVLPEEMKEHSIEIHEVSLSKVDGSELKAPMIPPSRY